MAVRRRRCVEVVQTSAMDCGPATLKCLLEGHGIRASYGRLREACQTDVDGTSITVIERTARALGLDAEQRMLPLDHLWTQAAAALPALVVVTRADGFAHFVVAWRSRGAWVEVMDPAHGRRWLRRSTFEREIMRHRHRVSAADWRAWAADEDAAAVLRAQLVALGASASQAGAAVAAAAAHGSWQALARLDAAQRMVHALRAAGALGRGAAAWQLCAELVAAAGSATEPYSVIPRRYWSVVALHDTARDDARADDEDVDLHGAVLVSVRGRSSAPPDTTQLSPELVAALGEAAPRPLTDLLTHLRGETWTTPLALLGAVLIAAVGVTFEAVLLRGLFALGRELGLVQQRFAAIGAVAAFAALLLAVQIPIMRETLRLGRLLELRLRLALARRLPLLPDRYLQSRPVSDMLERAHSVAAVRQVPAQLLAVLQNGAQLFCTWLAIALLVPAQALTAGVIALLAAGLPIAAQRAMQERDLRVRSHGGALQGFYLDALLGAIPIRAHGAERAVEREHEALLAAWARAAWHKVRLGLVVEGTQMLSVSALAAALLWAELRVSGLSGEVLLLAYWALRLPASARALGDALLQLPGLRAVALRLQEPLNAQTDGDAATPPAALHTAAVPAAALSVVGEAPRGVAFELRKVAVMASGRTLLDDVDLRVEAGEHLAIVGASGAGKSTLLALLLGFLRAAEGSVTVDGTALDEPMMADLRRHTAWIDPAVQLWNRSLLDNLCYAGASSAISVVGHVVRAADLVGVVARLPDGLQTRLGEGGALLSGGEGQRVRLGRALHQGEVRLVLLDEPFRGLDRRQRQQQLALVRAWWPHATLICVTHDVAATREFPRVLVVDDGRLVEDSTPAVLLAQRDSHYRALLEAERVLHRDVWQAATWRRLHVSGGKLNERASRDASSERNEQRA